MRVLPQLLLPRLRLVRLRLYPTPFSYTPHILAQLWVRGCTAGRSFISFFVSGALSPKPIHSSELFRRPVRINHDPTQQNTGKGGTTCRWQSLSQLGTMASGIEYHSCLCEDSIKPKFDVSRRCQQYTTKLLVGGISSMTLLRRSASCGFISFYFKWSWVGMCNVNRASAHSQICNTSQ